ncbi:reverse transcriptase domain-containing protein [Tanacetum coccineum]
MTPESVQAMIDQALLRNSTNGDGSHSSHGDNRRNVQTARPCFYADFMKCQPLNFKGTEGVVGLTRWIEKMESFFNISWLDCEYFVKSGVKFATCTLLGAALTWWNGQLRTLGPEEYVMTWDGLKKKMTDKYWQQGEIKKLEIELWNLKDQDVWMRDYWLANDLMDQKLRTYAERQSDNKRKADDSSRNNHGHQQQPFKRQNVAKGNLPATAGILGKHKCCNTQKAMGVIPRGMLYLNCGAPGHFKRDCPKLKNKDGGNGSAQGWVYAVGNAKKKSGRMHRETRTPMSSRCSLIDIAPSPLENSYDIELADGKIVRIDTIIQGCTLNFLNHSFNIDLMPVELGSFDVIIDMDWLRRCHAVIVCDEKLVRILYGNETLIFHGDENIRQEGGGQDKTEHEEHLKAILELLKKEKLYAKFLKCKFWIPKVQFLGQVIDSRGIHVDPAKIESIKDWASPKTSTEIRQFLGLDGYYQRFIKEFLKIAKSMTKLTQKGIMFDWGEKEENAFQLIKQKLCSAPILAL